MRHLKYEVKPQQGSKQFLDRFPDNQRTWAMAQFLTTVRAGVRDPDQVVEQVLSESQSRSAVSWMSDGADKAAEKHANLLDLLSARPGEARQLAAYCCWWESLPPEERTRLKRERGDRCREDYLRGLPPTDAQVNLLRELGHSLPPGNRQDASDQIESILAARRGGGR